MDYQEVEKIKDEKTLDYFRELAVANERSFEKLIADFKVRLAAGENIPALHAAQIVHLERARERRFDYLKAARIAIDNFGAQKKEWVAVDYFDIWAHGESAFAYLIDVIVVQEHELLLEAEMLEAALKWKKMDTNPLVKVDTTLFIDAFNKFLEKIRPDLMLVKRESLPADEQEAQEKEAGEGENNGETKPG